MADDVVLPGTGEPVATDEIGGAHYQKIKPFWGPEGTATEIDTGTPLPVVQTGTPALATGAATQATLAAVLAKLIAAPSTEAKQDTLIAKDFATQTTLAAVLAKIIAAPATEAKQDTGNTSLGTIAGKDFATQTTLAAVLAKIIAAPATEAKQDTIIGHVDGLESVLGTTAGASVITDANGTVQQYLRGLIKQWIAGTLVLGIGTNSIGTVQPGNTANTTPWLVKEGRSATGTQSSVAGSASDVTILASNASRLGATVYNDSTVTLYLLLANATSSTTVHTVQMTAGAYYEVPSNYTGVIKGIWASATGSARVTELT